MRFNLYFIIICTTLYAADSLVSIKVLISRTPLNQSITLINPKGLVITCPDSESKKYYFKNKITIKPTQYGLRINNKTFCPQLDIIPLGGYTKYQTLDYAGSFQLFLANNKIYIINKIPLEDYIDSVLRTEGWPGWPLEVYKVFAIASRTYVIYHLQQARKQKKLYHVSATNLHQTYQGVHHCKTIKDAVEQTAGIFLAYNNQPILAMYDSSCGGITPAKTTNIIDFSKAPYLARSYACSYCKGYKISSWRKSIPFSKFKQTMKEVFPSLNNVTKIYTKKDDAGIVQEIIIMDGKRKFNLSRSKFYSLFSEIKSFSFNCSREGNQVLVRGSGFGHHIGLCQWGAWEMVKRGYNYKKILHFYYPETKFMKLSRLEKKEK